MTQTFPKLTTSPYGLKLIKHFEGLRLTPYRCTAGHLTVGWGHKLTVRELREYRDNPRAISVAEAFEYLVADCRIAELFINAKVRVRLTQYQFDALVSFCFNLGVGAFDTSTLRQKLNMGDVLGAADEFLRWNKEKNPNWLEDHPKEQKYRVVEGLTRRRKAERLVFLGAPLLTESI